MDRSAWRLRTVGAVVLAMVVGCGGGGDGGGGGVQPTGTISINVSPGSLNVTQGQDGTITVTLTRGGGFGGSVTLTAQGVPSGVTIAGTTIAAGSTSADLTIAAAGSAATGPSTVTIRATGSGVTAATALLTLTIEVSAENGFSPSISVASVNVEAGASASVTIDVNRASGFTDAVTFSARDVPNGLTVSFDPTVVTGATTTLTLEADPGLAEGEYTITVDAEVDDPAPAPEGAARQAAVVIKSFTITVTIGPPGGGGGTPSISIALSVSNLTIEQGEDGQVGVTLTRAGGFTGDVTLTAEGLPSGVTADQDNVSSGETSGNIQLNVSPTATTGTFSVTIRATANGVSDATGSVSLLVTQDTGGGGGGGNSSYTFCDGNLPLFFAYKDGNGAWVAVQPMGNSYSFNLSSGHGGVAWVNSSGGAATVQIFLGSSAQLANQGATCVGTPTGKTVNVMVAGLNSGEQASISMGSAAGSVFAGAGTTATLMNVANGDVDLLGSASEFVINGSTVTVNLRRLYLERGLNPADGSTVNLDFNSSNAFDPEFRNLTINNLSGEMAIASSLFFTSNLSAAGTFFSDISLSSSTMRMFPTLPANRFQPGDLQLVTVSTAGNPNQTTFRNVTTMSATPTDQTVTLGPTPNPVNLSAAATMPYYRPRAMTNVQTEYSSWFALSFSQTGGNTLVVSVTSDYLDGASTFDFTSPDFSGLTGWNNAWGLQTGLDTFWGFTATGWTGGQGFFTNPFVDGASWHTGTTFDQFTP